MSENTKDNSITFRLNDADNEKLEAVSNSYTVKKSNMVTQIVENFLNENNQQFEINCMSYPRPIMKKLLTTLTEAQKITMIADMNNYNIEIIQSSKRVLTNEEIFDILKKNWKRCGCEVRVASFDKVRVLEIHHEMEKNWSIITCSTTTFILELLDNIIKNTTVTDNWFKIEFTM